MDFVDVAWSLGSWHRLLDMLSWMENTHHSSEIGEMVYRRNYAPLKGLTTETDDIENYSKDMGDGTL